MSNTWEVVTKNQKKSKIPQHVGPKSKKKIDPSSMPKIEAAAPVKESPTIYDAFIDKQASGAKQVKEPAKPVGNGIGSAPQKKNVPKKKPVEKKPVKASLEDLMEQVNADDIKETLVKEQTMFPDNPPIWLMDIASVINMKLDNAADNDPVLEGKPKDYPLCLLPKSVKEIILKIMAECPADRLEGFVEQCVQQMVIEMGKGMTSHGFRIFIQLTSQKYPEAVINCLPKYIDLAKNNQNRHLRCLSIMWAVGQVGYVDLHKGLKVWFELMLPYLNIRNLASYIVDYLDHLFVYHEKKKPTSSGSVDEKHFFRVFDLIHNPQQLGLPGPLQKKLLALYPKLKEVSFPPESENISKVFFPSFLSRCDPECKELLKKELLACSVSCLKADKFNFSQWRQMYTRHLPQSSVLLNHLCENWKAVGSKLDKKALKETIKAFSLTNEDLAKKGKNDPDCDKACKDLSNKVNAAGFPWFWLFMFMVSMVCAVIAYDVYIHKSFKNSKTRQLLSDSGLLVYMEHAWSRVVLYTGKVWLWLQENVPFYYGKMCEVVSPYLSMFWEKLFQFGLFIVEITEPARNWLGEKVPIILEWINSKLPWLWSNVSYYCGMVFGFIVKYTLTAWEIIVYYSFHIGAWLQENVFTGSWSIENIQKVLLSWLEALRTLIQYCGVKLSALFSGAANKS